MVNRRKPPAPAHPASSSPQHTTAPRQTADHTHTRRRAALQPRLVDSCAICHWDGKEPAIWGPFKQQQWATPEHDLCTDPDCMRIYKERARAGTL